MRRLLNSSDMETTGPRSSSDALRPAHRWPLYVGAYTLVCALSLLLATSQVTGLVADVLALPWGSPLWFVVPVPVFGAVLWWRLVELPGRYSYPRGVAVGLLTALFTTLVWVLWGVYVWDPETVAAFWLLVAIVLVPTVPAGLVSGLPAMYARRNLADGPVPSWVR